MFSLICVWIDGWVNNREAGDLRRYRAQYDVTVIINFGTGTDNCSHMPCNMQNEITYAFLNFNGYTLEDWGWIKNSLFIMDAIIYTYRA